VLSEVKSIFALFPFWGSFAWEDIKTTYRRTLFGVLWITLTFLAFLSVKLLIFKPLQSSAGIGLFTIYLALGFAIWQYIATVLSSSNTFLSFENWIRNDTIPIAGYPIVVLLRCQFNFVFQVFAVLIIISFFGVQFSWAMLTLIPAYIILVIMSYFTLLFFGVISLRYRDIAQVVQTFTRMGFFLSPVFWMPENMGPLMKYLWWNPAAHFIWIFRDPVMYGIIPYDSWIFVLTVTAITTIAAIVSYRVYRRQLVFWF
tara:strand:- start:6104 stop:6874 length:771 start_codon:yes stop_codon:yes gene_type:complete